MHAVVKSISSDEFDLDVFEPENRSCFCLNLRIRIGLAGNSGADDFELGICTPEWLNQTVWEPLWGRHLLIVREYSLPSIEEHIRTFVAQCNGSDWNAIAFKLARVFAWEFEDYQS
ncbi:immunity 8 family protein [Paraburkholderia tropica]|uniref:immunity 8 family protein n=1 Tax=Paraburkholderia tropica TaxID=92647 RepID=UPI0015920577|nr:immunity 8 family protein [Paraburkholderia tropica]